MSTLELVLSIIGALTTLSGVGVGFYVSARSSSQEARITRLQGERDDYLSRLNYIEPRFAAAEEQNALLRTLHDPSTRLDRLDHKASQILAVLDRNSAVLKDIGDKIHGA